MRMAQPASVCQAGLGSYDEQPLPDPCVGGLLALFTQAVSFQPRVLVATFSWVPPTEVTYGEAEGYCTPP
jgi:hypothetical protein